MHIVTYNILVQVRAFLNIFTTCNGQQKERSYEHNAKSIALILKKQVLDKHTKYSIESYMDPISHKKIKSFPVSRKIFWSYPVSHMTFTLFESCILQNCVSNPVSRRQTRSNTASHETPSGAPIQSIMLNNHESFYVHSPTPLSRI